MKGKMKSGSIVILLLAIACLCNAQSPEKLLNEYRNNLNALRKLHPSWSSWGLLFCPAYKK